MRSIAPDLIRPSIRPITFQVVPPLCKHFLGASSPDAGLRKHFHFYRLNHYASRPFPDVLPSVCAEQASAARPAHIPSTLSLKRTLHLLSDRTLFNYPSLVLIKPLSLPASLPLRHALYLPSSLRLSVPSVPATVLSSSFIPPYH